MNPTRIIIEFADNDPSEEIADWTTTPEAILRAKSELLAEFLGYEVDDAERLLLDRITHIGE